MEQRYKDIKHAFNKAANTYDYNCSLQLEIGRQLIELIKRQGNSFDSMIDLGCGTGLITEFLKNEISCRKLYAIDLADALLRLASERLKYDVVIESSFDSVPLKDKSVDLVFSNMSFQWSYDLKRTIDESSRILKKSGLLAFSIPNKESFKEVRESIENLDMPNFLNDFFDVSGLRYMLSDYTILEFPARIHTSYYGSVLSLLKSIKNIGASHIKSNSQRRLTNLDFMVLDEYFKKSVYKDKIPLSYVITYCVAIRK